MIVERPTYIQQITPFIGKNVIKVLTGVRRSGKSTLLDLIKPVLISHGADESNILHLRFESERYANIRTDDDLVDYVASHVDTNPSGHAATRRDPRSRPLGKSAAFIHG